jgi:hypothetical protein
LLKEEQKKGREKCRERQRKEDVNDKFETASTERTDFDILY